MKQEEYKIELLYQESEHGEVDEGSSQQPAGVGNMQHIERFRPAGEAMETDDTKEVGMKVIETLSPSTSNLVSLEDEIGNYFATQILQGSNRAGENWGEEDVEQDTGTGIEHTSGSSRSGGSSRSEVSSGAGKSFLVRLQEFSDMYESAAADVECRDAVKTMVAAAVMKGMVTALEQQAGIALVAKDKEIQQLRESVEQKEAEVMKLESALHEKEDDLAQLYEESTMQTHKLVVEVLQDRERVLGKWKASEAERLDKELEFANMAEKIVELSSKLDSGSKRVLFLEKQVKDLQAANFMKEMELYALMKEMQKVKYEKERALEMMQSEAKERELHLTTLLAEKEEFNSEQSRLILDFKLSTKFLNDLLSGLWNRGLKSGEKVVTVTALIANPHCCFQEANSRADSIAAMRREIDDLKKEIADSSIERSSLLEQLDSERTQLEARDQKLQEQGRALKLAAQLNQALLVWKKHLEGRGHMESSGKEWKKDTQILNHDSKAEETGQEPGLSTLVGGVVDSATLCQFLVEFEIGRFEKDTCQSPSASKEDKRSGLSDMLLSDSVLEQKVKDLEAMSASKQDPSPDQEGYLERRSHLVKNAEDHVARLLSGKGETNRKLQQQLVDLVVFRAKLGEEEWRSGVDIDLVIAYFKILLENLVNQSTEVGKHLNDIEGQLAANQEDLQATKTSLEKSRGESEILKAENTVLSKFVDQLTEEIESCQGEILICRTQLKDASLRSEKSKADFYELQGRTDDMRGALEGRLEEKDWELKKLREEFEQTQWKNEAESSIFLKVIDDSAREFAQRIDDMTSEFQRKEEALEGRLKSKDAEVKKLTEELELSRRERETEASTSPEVVQERACECVQKIEHLTATFNRKEAQYKSSLQYASESKASALEVARMLKRRESAEKAETSHQKKSLRKTLDEERERLFDLVKSLQEQCRSGKIFESEFLSQEAQLREVLEQERRRVYDVLIQMEGLHRSKDAPPMAETSEVLQWRRQIERDIACQFFEGKWMELDGIISDIRRIEETSSRKRGDTSVAACDSTPMENEIPSRSNDSRSLVEADALIHSTVSDFHDKESSILSLLSETEEIKTWRSALHHTWFLSELQQAESEVLRESLKKAKSSMESLLQDLQEKDSRLAGLDLRRNVGDEGKVKNNSMARDRKEEDVVATSSGSNNDSEGLGTSENKDENNRLCQRLETEAHIKSLTAELVQKESRIAELESSCSEIEGLRIALQQSGQECGSLSAEVSTLCRSLDEFKAEMDTITNSWGEDSADVADLMSKIGTLRNSLQFLDCDKSKVTETLKIDSPESWSMFKLRRARKSGPRSPELPEAENKVPRSSDVDEDKNDDLDVSGSGVKTLGKTSPGSTLDWLDYESLRFENGMLRRTLEEARKETDYGVREVGLIPAGLNRTSSARQPQVVNNLEGETKGLRLKRCGSTKELEKIHSDTESHVCELEEDIEDRDWMHRIEHEIIAHVVGDGWRNANAQWFNKKLVKEREVACLLGDLQSLQAKLAKDMKHNQDESSLVVGVVEDKHALKDEIIRPERELERSKTGFPGAEGVRRRELHSSCSFSGRTLKESLAYDEAPLFPQGDLEGLKVALKTPSPLKGHKDLGEHSLVSSPGKSIDPVLVVVRRNTLEGFMVDIGESPPKKPNKEVLSSSKVEMLELRREREHLLEQHTDELYKLKREFLNDAERIRVELKQKFQREVATLEEELVRVKQELLQAMQEKERCQTDLEKDNMVLPELQMEVEALESCDDTNQLQADARVASIEAERDQLREEITGLESRIMDLQDEVTRLEGERSWLEERVPGLEKKLATEQSRLEDTVAGHAFERDRLKLIVSGHKIDQSRLEDDVAQLKSERNYLATAVATLGLERGNKKVIDQKERERLRSAYKMSVKDMERVLSRAQKQLKEERVQKGTADGEAQRVKSEMLKSQQELKDFWSLLERTLAENIGRAVGASQQVESTLCQKIHQQCLKFQGLQEQVKYLQQVFAGSQMNESEYVHAVDNLRKAEEEVDLLGDEVDALTALLEKVYTVLEHYAPVLRHYPGVAEVAQLVKLEVAQRAVQLGS